MLAVKRREKQQWDVGGRGVTLFSDAIGLAAVVEKPIATSERGSEGGRVCEWTRPFRDCPGTDRQRISSATPQNEDDCRIRTFLHASRIKLPLRLSRTYALNASEESDKQREIECSNGT